MNPRLDTLFTAVLSVAAVAMLALVAKRELAGAKQVDARGRPTEPRYVVGWERLADSGIVIGNPEAPVRIVEFMDYECPFCKRSDSVNSIIRKEFGSKVAFVFVHHPGSNHRFAIPAARASECANEQGLFDPMSTLLLEKQDSLGLKSWHSYAYEAGVRDSARFVNCLARPGQPPRIASGLSVGNRIGIRATPTLVLNGWLLPYPPTHADLRASINRLLDGKPLGKRSDSIVFAGR